MKRVFLTTLLLITAIIGANAEIYSGKIDKKISWKVDTETGVLSFTSSGNKNTLALDGQTAPWKKYAEYIITVVIGNGITNVAQGVFNDLYNVSIIVFNNEKGQGGIPSIDEDNFNETDKENVIIIVPDGTKEEEVDNLIEDLGGNEVVGGDNIIKGDVDEEEIGSDTPSTGDENNTTPTIYKCGEQLNAVLQTKTLRITGSGAMYNYDNSTNLTPWRNKEITSLSIDSRVTQISAYAFDNCTQITEIAIPANVTSIGSNAFNGCNNLTSVHISDLTAWCNTDFENKASNPLYYAKNLYLNGTQITNLDIPNEVTEIKKYAFNGCNLTSVTAHTNVTTIEENAFDGCSLLNTITFNSNPAIASNAIPNGVIKNLIIKDKQQMLTNSNSYDQIEYVRTFNNTNWQPLYLPCTISYEDWSENFDIARINNIHQYDYDEDGNIDRSTIEIFYIKSGSLTPNTPYFIKAKKTGSITLTIEAQQIAPEETINKCASWTDEYHFIGTYNGVKSSEMTGGNYYGMSGGSLISMTNATNNLSPLRWYLEIKSRSSAAQYVRPNNIHIKEIGGTTDIQEITSQENDTEDIYYDLSGRRVDNPKQGIYIINNKKIYIR